MGGDRTRYEVAVAATVNVPDDTNYVEFTGTDTVTALNASGSTRNRMVVFYSTSGTTTLTNTDSATTAGQMDLGGSNIALGATDAIILWLRSDGVWVRLTPVANN